jgi:hypothetical protein
MSDRLAHRPRYHGAFKHIHPTRYSNKDYLRTGWSYRRQTPKFEKHTPGYSLSFVPLGYKFVRGLLTRYA